MRYWARVVSLVLLIGAAILNDGRFPYTAVITVAGVAVLVFIASLKGEE